MAVIARSSRRLTSAGAPLALLSAAIITLGTACASTPSAKPAASPATPPASAVSNGPKPSPNLITADEIARVNAQNAYEAVQKLRPAMLRPRQVASANGQGGVSQGSPAKSGTATTSGELVVYVDGTRLGDIGQLRGIPAFSIASMRYYSASEAQMKWGSGHPGGVIEVTSKR
jgi:hypothetical protein